MRMVTLLFQGRNPDVVVLPKDVGQVSSVLKICNEGSVPVVPFSTTTGLEGGVFIDLMSMDKIVEVNTSDFNCIIEPGVTLETLNHNLHTTGLWFPGDPGANASICGMAATNATGTNAVRYGTMVQNVLNLEVVLPNGDVLYTAGKGRRPRKSAGYNLTKLFVGSKGTLGVITQAAVRLYARPAVCSVAICPFRTVDKAIEAVVATLQCSVPIAKIEFLDAATVAACNRYSKLTLAESPTLFLEFHGNSEAEVAEQASLVGEIFASNDGTEFIWSHAPEEQKKLWVSFIPLIMLFYRKKIMLRECKDPARDQFFCTGKGLTIHFSLPTSALVKTVAETRKEIDECGIFGAIVGHVGDGCFHCIFLVDESNQEEMKIIQELSDRIIKRVLVSGGSCTGEHGIGISKRNYLENECGRVAVNTMIAIKKALDPKGLMNPNELCRSFFDNKNTGASEYCLSCQFTGAFSNLLARYNILNTLPLLHLIVSLGGAKGW
ncbi:putative D-lactate dehydrogenase, mitochondrial [Dirofilaria immitis]|nr:putative D-lactate dehydrogenase, mitochondrial [Dirofilaria immitis]